LERILQSLSDACLRRPVFPALLLAAVLLATMASALKPPFGGDGGSEKLPNVILITVDTLRADHLSDYGYHLPTTPEIDRSAKEATIFTNCISTAPNTVPALASIMTSQYPSFHSAGTTNGMQAMVTDEPTLARILSENGYSTAAFVSNYVLSRKVRMYGGFDIYDDTFTSFELVRGVPERTADKTTEYVLNWLAAMTNERFFLWAHYQDPHGPYTPPARYEERFPEAAYPAGPEKLAVRDNFGKGVVPDYQYLSGHTSPSYYRARYDAEIAYADECIGRLLARVRELGLWERSIVVFTADHGESMGEHDYYFSHGHDLTDEQIHVPLIMHIPGAAQVERVDELVSSVDIPRTILAAVGLKEELGSSGLNLMSLVEGKARRLDREYVVSEDSRGRISFRSRQTKYIAEPDGERLYDLARDAHESKNILDERPRLADDWRTIRDGYRQAARPRKGTSLYYDSEHVEKLRSLGYIN
jgi:arylsulfatase A-like enzyme